MLIYGLQLRLWYRFECFDVISVDFLLVAFMLLAWYDVRRDFKRISARYGKARDGKDQAIQLEDFPAKLHARMPWVLFAYVSIQLNGWIIGNKSHDRKQLASHVITRTPRQLFLHTVSRAITYYGIIEAIGMSPMVRGNPNFVKMLAHVPQPSVLFNMASLFALLAFLYAALALYTYYVPMMLAIVGAQLYPALWQHPFLSPLSIARYEGDPSAVWSPSQARPAWGLRAFWGYVWHQNLRYITSIPGVAAAHSLGIRPGTLLSYAVTVTSAFFFSGIMHMGIVPPHPSKSAMTAWDLRILIGSFFWCQTIGVLIEAAVDAILGELRVPRPMEDGQAPKANAARIHWQLHPVSRICMIVWTCAFMSGAVWFSGRIVGKELGWWSLHGSPISPLAYLRGDPDWYRQWF